MIKLKKLLEASIHESPYTKDGWNDEFFQIIGFFDIADRVQRMAYELQNARRGSYGISGPDLEDFLNDCQEIVEEFSTLVNDLPYDVSDDM